MSNSPFFSVIMPIYNVEKYLDAAIKSVLRQTFRDFELILVDDGSTDASGAIARRYQELDPRIRLLWQENAGLSAARNTGLEHARGRYVYFIDSDDMIDRTTFRSVFSLISGNDSPDVVAFNAMPFLDDAFPAIGSESVLQDHRRPYAQTYLNDGLYTGVELYLKRTRAQNFLPSAWLFVIKRALLQEINLRFVDGVLHEDEVFSRYLFIHAKSIFYTNKKLYQRRIRAGSIMQSEASEHKILSLLIVAGKIFALREQSGLPELEGDALRLYRYALELYEKQARIAQSIERCLVDSPLFLRDLRKITPAGQSFEMYVPSSLCHRYLDGIYQPLTTRVVSHYILENSIFIEIGAGLGYFSLVAAAQAKAKKIISIETAPNAFEVLSKNVSLNQAQGIVLDDRAIWPGGETRLGPDDFSSLLPGEDDSNLFFKISAPGEETAIVSALKGRIERAFPKVRLLVEYNPEKVGDEPGDLFDLLFSLGFDVFLLDDAFDVACKVEAGFPAALFQNLSGAGKWAGVVNLLCLPRQPLDSVLIFSHSSSLAGSERSLRALISEFPRLGIVPTVVMPSEGPFRQYLHETGALTTVFPFGWWSDIKQVSIDEGQARLAKDFQAIQEGLVPLINRVNPDVILTNTTVIPWGSICAFLVNKPHLWYVRELGLPEHGINYFYPREVIGEYIQGGSNLVITNSTFARKSFFGESASVRVEVIHPFLDIDTIKEPAEAENFFHQVGSFKLACLGGIVPGKGQADAIYALKELISAGEKVEIVFAGGFDPEYYNMLLGLVREFDLSSYVHFVGFIEFPYSLYAQADAVLVCSRNESFGRVALEAMSLGKPVIAASSGGTLELIEDEQDGLLYPPGDVAQLAGKISRFIHEPETRVRLGRQAAWKARANFSRDAISRKFYETLRGVAGEKNRASQKYIYWIFELERKIREIQVAEKDAQLTQAVGHLAAVHSSKLWQFGHKVRQMRLRISPPGSLRARIIDDVILVMWKVIKR